MTAPSPRDKAIAALVELNCPTPAIAVDAVLDTLVETNDRRTMQAGASELLLAMPFGVQKSYATNLAGVVWRAMLRAAR